MQSNDTALLIEGSPWGYFLRLGSELPREEQVACQHALASLRLPDVFVVLGATGREVARRQGAADIDQAGPAALKEMRQLELLPGALLGLDATPPLASVS